MKISEIRESKAVLICGLAGTVLLVPVICLLLINGVCTGDSELFFLALGFGVFLLSSLFMVWEYFRKRFVLYPDYAVCSPLFGKKVSFSYQEIQSIRITASNKYMVIAQDGRKLASFHYSMAGIPEAVSYLTGKGIRLEQPKSYPVLFRFRHSLAQYIKSSRNKQADELAFIQSKWSGKTILREKKLLTVIRPVLVCLFMASFFLPHWMLRIHLSILFFSWFLYLWMYPKMALDCPNADSENAAYYMPLRFFACITALSLLLLMTYTQYMDYDRRLCLFSSVRLCSKRSIFGLEYRTLHP